jgi:type IV secretory pathway TrbL component
MAAKTDDVARVLLKEVPLGQLKSFLQGPPQASNAMGQGCGGGAGCIDAAGHTGLTDAEIKAALNDPASLKAAITRDASSALTTM